MPGIFGVFLTIRIVSSHTKMKQIATNNGVAAFCGGAFVMFPKLDVYDIQTVEGGMKAIRKPLKSI